MLQIGRIHTQTAASDLVALTGCLQEGADMDDQEQDSINRELTEFAIQESMKEVKKSAQTSRFDPGLSNPGTILTELKEISINSICSAAAAGRKHTVKR